MTALPPTVVTADVVTLTLRTGHTGGAGSGAEAGTLSVLTVTRAVDDRAAARALPGVELDPDEDLAAAARRALAEVAGLAPAELRHLEQLATFGAPDRDPQRRRISVSYLGLLPRPATPGANAAWTPVEDTPALALDHDDILETAVERLRGKLTYSTVAYGLLPDEFTLSELQGVYEAVLGARLDKRNFRKKVLGLELVVATGDVRRGPHRPAQLYRFRRRGLVLLDDVIHLLSGERRSTDTSKGHLRE